MDEPLDFAVTSETLFRNAFAADVTPRMKERLRALGLDLDKPLLPGDPAKLWPQVMRCARAGQSSCRRTAPRPPSASPGAA